MQADLILCDHAEAVNGKLYINGGGWNMLFAPNRPINTALAILIEVQWDETHVGHHFNAELLTADGDPVLVNGIPVRFEGDFQLEQPPGVKPGTTLNTPLAVQVGGLSLPEGGYEWRLFIDGKSAARKPFLVLNPPFSGGFAV